MSFGTGIRLTSSFDVDVSESSGSLETVDERAIVERDIAFTLAREGEARRGTIADAEFSAEIEILTRRLLARDPRIASVDSVSVDLGAGARSVAVSVSVTTADGETTALILNPDI